jgi:type IV secretory pathway VirB2 component (pilin)
MADMPDWLRVALVVAGVVLVLAAAAYLFERRGRK